MNSLEIAELTGKIHKNVIRDIRTMLRQLKAAAADGSTLSFHCESGFYVSEQGKQLPLYWLDKNTTITLLSGYDVVARHKIIQRWQQLEEERSQVSESPEVKQLLVFTQRPKQIANSKEVNSYNFSQGGKDQAIAYNRANCFHHTGKTPHEILHWAKTKGVPSKHRTSAKEVIRTFKPAVASSMALADDFCKTGRIGIDEASIICKTHALPLFQKMQELGITEAPKPVPQLKQAR
ncbi:Rha family transcriptional regulator [Spirosoma sordidisoli]|nr:Rha family transcriptional regulator [Spirosoma sordidisoli]